ncbi:hypothetical protein CG709_04360 [Lachnotalea glycerini]|nr:hypothetical protein CG709_04360 [Lachnotalea glycerini]
MRSQLIVFFFFKQKAAYGISSWPVGSGMGIRDMDVAIPLADRIIFIEDEVTTGNTIMNIIHEIEQKYRSRVSFAVASLLNGMDETALRKYQEYNISMYYLVKTDHSQYEKIADNYYGDGSYTSIMQDLTCHYTDELLCTNAVNARRLTQGEVMQEACVGLWNQINAKYVFDKVQSILVLGTEEFMYPALFVADKMERSGLRVKFHATTRSPITVSSEDSYPLNSSRHVNTTDAAVEESVALPGGWSRTVSE